MLKVKVLPPFWKTGWTACVQLDAFKLIEFNFLFILDFN